MSFSQIPDLVATAAKRVPCMKIGAALMIVAAMLTLIGPIADLVASVGLFFISLGALQIECFKNSTARAARVVHFGAILASLACLAMYVHETGLLRG